MTVRSLILTFQLVAAIAFAACTAGDAEQREPAPERAAAHAAATDVASDAVWQSTSGPYRVRLTRDDIVVSRGTRTVLSIRDALDTIPDRAVAVDVGDTAGSNCEEDHAVRILSLVGSILSLEDDFDYNCDGAAHPGRYNRFVAIDLARTERDGVRAVDGGMVLGREISLEEIFPEQELLEALLADAVVRKQLEGSQQTPATLAELVEQVQGSRLCAYAFEPDMLRRFSFHHVEGDKVAVRIALSHGCEAERGRITQIGLLLRIPEALRSELAAASAGTHGILMRDAQKRFGTHAVAIAHRYRLADEDAEGAP
jgi:hypothetical protein